MTKHSTPWEKWPGKLSTNACGRFYPGSRRSNGTLDCQPATAARSSRSCATRRKGCQRTFADTTHALRGDLCAVTLANRAQCAAVNSERIQECSNAGMQECRAAEAPAGRMQMLDARI